MIRLDRPWDMLLLHKVDAEEHEGVGWPGDVLTLNFFACQVGTVYVWARALVVGRGWRWVYRMLHVGGESSEV
jgi:hypothetical protein